MRKFIDHHRMDSIETTRPRSFSTFRYVMFEAEREFPNQQLHLFKDLCDRALVYSLFLFRFLRTASQILQHFRYGCLKSFYLGVHNIGIWLQSGDTPAQLPNQL